MARELTKLKTMMVLLLVFMAGTVLAAPPVAWMPNFPMRMPGVGVMGMWMPVPGATEYKVLKQVGTGEWTQLAKGPMNNFQDPAAPMDKDVSYKIVAIVGGADAGESAVVALRAEKPIEPPTGIDSRLDTNQKTLSLRWTGAAGATFYNVYRSESEKAEGAILGSVQDLKYVDTNVADGKTYWYEIASVSSTSKESKRSEKIKIAVVFPKAVVVKTFTSVRREMTNVGESYGEVGADFKNPSDVEFIDDRVLVACEDGVQVLNSKGDT